MVEVLDPQEGEIICDPCCGSGGFLIKAFEYVRAKIEQEIHEQKEKIKGKKHGRLFVRVCDCLWFWCAHAQRGVRTKQ